MVKRIVRTITPSPISTFPNLFTSRAIVATMLLMSSRFQIDAPEATRRAVKIEALKAGILVSQMAVIALDHVMAILASGKVPADLRAAIEAAKPVAEEKPATEERPTRGKK